MGRIGIFGGTFNPIHYGHLINIEFIREQYALDTIILIPAKIPVHKKIDGCVTTVERLEMTRLAVEENLFIQVSSVEIDRDSPSYTIITMNELKDIYPDEKLYLIIGSDSFNELDTWMSYKEILSSIALIVMKRPGSTELRNDLLEISEEVNVVNNPQIEISSSMIRERINKGLSVRYLIPDTVVEYINKKGLYTN